MKLATTMFALLIYLAHMTVVFRAIKFFKENSKQFKSPTEHGLYSLLGLLAMSTALSLFRILQDVETRTIKYMHAFLHAIVCALMYYSLLKLEDPEWHYMHGFPAFIIYYSYFVQIGISLLVFCVIPAGDLRESICIIHNVIGVWLYHCYVGVAISGWHSCNRKHTEAQASGVENDGCLLLLDHYKSLLIVGAILLNCLLLFPFFQWEIVGSL